MKKSTHLVEYGRGRSAELAIVCGNYYRALRSFVFGGGVQLMPWKRIPENALITPCSEMLYEIEPCGMLGTSDNIN